MAVSEEDDSALSNMDNREKKNTKPPLRKEKITKSKGLKRKPSNKLVIVNEDMDTTQFLQVIGPRYIMKNIAIFPENLPVAPTLTQEEKTYNDVKDLQNQNLSPLPPERDLSDSDELESKTTIDEIIKSVNKKICKDAVRRRDLLGNSSNKRGLGKNKFIQIILQRFLPKNMRSPPHNLQVLHQKPILNMVGTNSIIKYDEKNILNLSQLHLGKPMSFKIVNTVSRLDEFPIRNDKTVFLQWANVGKIRSIRNIRVDGIRDKKSILERLVFHLDRKLGASAMYFIDKYKSYILLFALISFLYFGRVL
ncbi:hypothetical protein OAI00_03265 [Euryarchaeota archaeon]|nr:hypothetical protein [Euryarchaeota archaeon]